MWRVDISSFQTLGKVLFGVQSYGCISMVVSDLQQRLVDRHSLVGGLLRRVWEWELPHGEALHWEVYPMADEQSKADGSPTWS